MKRRTQSLFGIAALVLLATAATGLAAKSVIPKTGLFKGSTSQEGEAILAKVSKVGRAQRVEVEINFLELQCEVPGGSGSVPLGTVALFGKKGKGDFTPAAGALSVKGGKFSYKGPVRNLQPAGTGEISGEFKSPNKFIGSGKFVYKNHGALNATCESGKVTFAATHG